MTKRHSFLMLVGCAGLMAWLAPIAQAVCAKVVIQIEQELTLEREGFEARLGVSNSLPSALENFQVTIKFSDVDGNPVGAYSTGSGGTSDKFFYRVQTGYTVPTSIAAGAEQKMAYLIVPVPGAAGTTPAGALYYVGATIKYTVAGEQQTVEVAPDYITVRPMPLLQLQYFLPGDVYGDDPHTVPVEPVVPFALGVRVINHSPYATARKVGILSSQPKIIENELGLLIDFKIVGCEVKGQAAQPTLQVNFGDIAPKRASVADWLMTASLSGSFTEFTAEVEHAPEFGGALTSLIPADAITTHRLIGQVLVDQSGRDGIPDFLGTDAMTGAFTGVKIFESDNDEVSRPVDYFAPNAPEVSVTPLPDPKIFSVAVTAASEVLYVRAVSPISADQTVRAVRSDGKALPPANCWISKTRDGAGPWEYSVNLFDTNKAMAQSYTLSFSTPAQLNQAPVLTLPAGSNYTVAQGQTLSIQATAVDPDGLIPALSTGPLPDGASFTDTTNGTGTLTWTPTAAQIGTYSIQFRASDASASDTKSVQVQVVESNANTYSAWTEQHWPGVTDPAIIGQEADPDGDQLANLLEYALDDDPTQPDDSVLPQIGLELVGGQSYLTLTYRQRTGDPALLYEVVASDNLTTTLAQWTVQAQTLTVNQDNLPAGLQRIKVKDSVPVSTGSTGSRYLRLRVTRN